jgi:hypothetical protein
VEVGAGVVVDPSIATPHTAQEVPASIGRGTVMVAVARLIGCSFGGGEHGVLR